MEAKESPYFLGNRECLPTQLVLKTTNQIVTQELPWDVSIDDLVNAFYTACIGITFQPATVLRAMSQFAAESLEVLESEQNQEE